MKVLVACESSGIVREAFRKKGHDAISADIKPSEDGGNHYQGNVLDIINNGFDLMIAHPPCTYLTVAGNRWFKPEYKHLYPNREQDRIDAMEFFMELYNANIPKICIENPVGIMSTSFRKPDQIIQPYQFGHEASKQTCLWLKNLPKLTPTKIVDKGEFVVSKSGKRMSKWFADAWNLPKEERSTVRSRTFHGIADAMADQWG